MLKPSIRGTHSGKNVKMLQVHYGEVVQYRKVTGQSAISAIFSGITARYFDFALFYGQIISNQYFGTFSNNLKKIIQDILSANICVFKTHD